MEPFTPELIRQNSGRGRTVRPTASADVTPQKRVVLSPTPPLPRESGHHRNQSSDFKAPYSGLLNFDSSRSQTPPPRAKSVLMVESQDSEESTEASSDSGGDESSTDEDKDEQDEAVNVVQASRGSFEDYDIGQKGKTGDRVRHYRTLHGHVSPELSQSYTDVPLTPHRLNSQPLLKRKGPLLPKALVKTQSYSKDGPNLRPAKNKRERRGSKTKPRWRVDPDKLSIGDEIGRGAFGVVRKGDYLGSPVAVKVIDSKVVKDEEAFRMFENEAKVMRSLRHPNIVLFMGLCESEGDLLLVQEFVAGGSLERLLKDKRKQLPWSMRARMVLQISRALAYLHERNCLHRDLKCENVLLDENGTAKVADFGLSRILGDSYIKHARQLQNANKQAMSSVSPAVARRAVPASSVDKEPTLHFGSRVGSTWYRAPEVEDAYYSSRIDIFSFGIVLAEILTRESGEDIRLSITYEKKFLKGKKNTTPTTSKFGVDAEKLPEFILEYAPDCPPSLIQLAMECVQEDPMLRPPISDVVAQLQLIYDNLHTMEEFVRQIVRKHDGEHIWMTALMPNFTGKISQQVEINDLAAVIAKHAEEYSGRKMEYQDLCFFKAALRTFAHRDHMNSLTQVKGMINRLKPIRDSPAKTPSAHKFASAEYTVPSILSQASSGTISLEEDEPVTIPLVSPRMPSHDFTNLQIYHRMRIEAFVSFWHWFRKLLKTSINPLLAHPFKTGLIQGFVSAMTAQDALDSASDGSCIIRFSQTFPGDLVFTIKQMSAFIHLRMAVTKGGLIVNQRHYASLKQAIAGDFELQRIKFIHPDRSLDDKDLKLALARAARSNYGGVKMHHRTTSF